jgi:filamentous hemagglutinin family protein
MRTRSVAFGWFVGLSMGMALGHAGAVRGQIVPDERTVERSQVSTAIGNSLFVQIDGGAVRGPNIFHQFDQFSLPSQGVAFFNNAATIRNIITRVSGNRASTIDGELRANGTANLFLINPNGIVLGPNASLNLGGAFVATTATTVEFGNQGSWDASTATVPLLTVNPSALLFNPLAAPAAVIVDRSTLQVPNGQRLALVGGPVRLVGATILAPGGWVDLVGLGAAGRVGLADGGALRFQGPPNQPLADIGLEQGSVVDVRAGGGGEISLVGDQVNLTEGSILQAGIAAGMMGDRAGDITITARSTVNLLQGSTIANSTLGTGDSGNVTITTNAITLRDGSRVDASTQGVGNGGKVMVRAQGPIILDGANEDSRSSGFSSRVAAGAVGNSGGIEVQATSLQVSNGGILTATTLGQGNSGQVVITVAGEVRLEGIGPDKLGSGVLSSVRGTGVGDSGGIQITAGSLVLERGAQLDASTSGVGNAGQVRLKIAGAVELRGDPLGQLTDPGGLYSFVGESAVGSSGQIDLEAASLTLRNGAALVATTFGAGNAGNIQVRVSGPVVLDGQLVVPAEPNEGAFYLSSGIFSSTGGTARRGNGGAISLVADTLQVTNGAAIAASTLAQGNAGNVTITVTGSARFDGVGLDGFPSGVFSSVRENGVGNGGNIQLTAATLELSRGAQLRARSQGRGDAGNIDLAIADTLSLQGFDAATDNFSGLFSTTEGVGQGGTIQVRTGNLNLRDRALISAQSQGRGRAGDIVVVVGDRLQAQDGQITTTATQSTGGAITLRARDIRLSGDSDITTSVFDGTGGGGDIAIATRVLIALDDSDILAFSRNGRGGNITVKAPVFFGQRYAPAPPDTDPTTLDGNGRVDINASGKLRSGVITLPSIAELQRSVVTLPSDVVDVNALIASSCIAKRQNHTQGSLIMTGTTGHVTALGDHSAPFFPTYEVVSPPALIPPALPRSSMTPPLPYQADRLYHLPNGDIVLGRTCN